MEQWNVTLPQGHNFGIICVNAELWGGANDIGLHCMYSPQHEQHFMARAVFKSALKWWQAKLRVQYGASTCQPYCSWRSWSCWLVARLTFNEGRRVKPLWMHPVYSDDWFLFRGCGRQLVGQRRTTDIKEALLPQLCHLFEVVRNSSFPPIKKSCLISFLSLPTKGTSPSCSYLVNFSCPVQNFTSWPPNPGGSSSGIWKRVTAPVHLDALQSTFDKQRASARLTHGSS